ncbi:MAG: hypothetical protein L0229_18640 [Blastocatellia bacterium]|nr:hypothetical protein [Blastocatellia bacterium]
MRATLISISGLSSGIGKTTVLCELLRRAPGWEAIKVSRGHYRSCGKNPEACCISPLLGEKPLILSGRAATYAPGKDTGRYWEAGASNVHWVVCTSEQVEEGVSSALSRVEAECVLVEGTSFLKYIPADYSIMVTDAYISQIKSSAARVMEKIDAVFVSGMEADNEILARLQAKVAERGYALGGLPVYFERDLERLALEVKDRHRARLSTVP